MSEQPAASRIQVEALAEGFQALAEQWASRLGLPLTLADADFSLQVGEQGLQLQQLGPDAPGPVRVDFVEGGAAHRRLYGGGSGQMIAKAVGIAQGVRPRVLDATAGLGKDAFVLASLGCEMSLIERQPLIGALLEDGLARGADDFDVAMMENFPSSVSTNSTRSPVSRPNAVRTWIGMVICPFEVSVAVAIANSSIVIFLTLR